ncbi:hypothetical protein GCM10023091_11200 [Ravibacter arvi]|uniref:Copper-binding protein MbnP-like domain-containing protein n=1 Tax=Ravibacter arvi TaxID=2051041 RepID=A0ABP8LUJ4_9BACT
MFRIYRLPAQLALLLTIALFTASCQDNAPTPGGKIRVEFDNVVGEKNLVLNGVTYQNQSGEDFVVTKLNYYISNIKFIRTDGTIYTVPQDSSYFLIREETRSSQFAMIRNVPLGEYDHIEFMVGVDSLRNTMPLSRRKGALDPGGVEGHDGMYWNWNSGYIFMKLEGTSPHGNPVNDKFYYHIGLFGGYDEKTVNNTRVVRLKFGDDKVVVTEEKTPEVHLMADVQKFFDGPGTQLSIANNWSVMGAQQTLSAMIANNYQQMFRYDHTH